MPTLPVTISSSTPTVDYTRYVLSLSIPGGVPVVSYYWSIGNAPQLAALLRGRQYTTATMTLDATVTGTYSIYAQAVTAVGVYEFATDIVENEELRRNLLAEQSGSDGTEATYLVASLASIAIVPGEQSVTISGRLAANDGAGGTFVKTATGALVVDNGIVFASADVAWKWVRT
jgi:hypothetical protein